jgi:hypothetical protein
MAGVDGLVFRVQILLGSATAQVLTVSDGVAVFHQHQVMLISAITSATVRL